MKIVLDIPDKTAYLATTAVIKDGDKEEVCTGVIRLAEIYQAAMVYSIMDLESGSDDNAKRLLRICSVLEDKTLSDKGKLQFIQGTLK